MTERLTKEEIANITRRLQFAPEDHDFAHHVAAVDAPRLIGHIDALERDLHAAEQRLALAEKLADAVADYWVKDHMWTYKPYRVRDTNEYHAFRAAQGST